MRVVMQVAPRPVLTNVALQVPVLAADASSAQLEADLLKGTLQLSHARLHLGDQVCAQALLSVFPPALQLLAEPAWCPCMSWHA